jgi:phosphatidylinositol glycan class T
VNANWRGLTNRLSGLTCASLNFLDETTSINPEFAYRPVGNIKKGNGGHLHVRVGSLPREFICTENLTPWTKLLPCGIMVGNGNSNESNF